MEQLDVLVANDQGDSKSAVALRERLEMMAEGRRHIEALLASNEEALTAMSRVTTKLAGVTTEGQAPEDMELMIEDLRDMAERTERYNTRIRREQPTITLNR